MRSALDKGKLLRFMEEIGKASRGPGRVYLTGGSTALLLGIREQTIDIDLKLDPEPPGVFEKIAALKEQLGINVELASPDQFIPPLPAWRERSEHIATFGSVEFYHYDFYSQALAKIERGHEQDISDARELLRLGKADAAELAGLFELIRPGLIRYPSINPDDFAARVKRFLREDRRENEQS